MGVTPHKYTDEEKAFLCEWVQGHSYKEIAEEFNLRFNHDFSISRIASSMKRYGAATGRNGCFKKGHTPHNKGKKMSKETYEKIKGTMFKKGNVPVKHRPVGSERVTKDGYIEVKVAEPDVWKLKQVHIWELANGEIPKSHVVIFLDGNIFNFDLDNLKCISRAENLYLNRNELRFNDKALTSAAVNVAKLNNAIKERSK